MYVREPQTFFGKTIHVWEERVQLTWRNDGVVDVVQINQDDIGFLLAQNRIAQNEREQKKYCAVGEGCQVGDSHWVFRCCVGSRW